MPDAQVHGPDTTASAIARGGLNVRWVASVLGLLVALLGLGVIVGWWLDLEWLTHVRHEYTPMKPNAAAGNVLAGLALALWLGRSGTTRATAVAVRILSGLLIGLGALTLVEYLARVDLRIDRLLLPTGGDVDAANPGRMALLTAVIFVAMGIGLLAVLYRRWTAVHGVAATVSAIGYVALLGHVYGASALYAVVAYTQMSVHMAAAACALGVALEFCVPDHGLGRLLADRGAAGRIMRTLIPSVALVIPLLGWAVLRGEQSGWYGSAFAAAVIAATVGILGSTLTIRAASAALLSDEGHHQARTELETLATTLEERVKERTHEAAAVALDLTSIFDAAPVGMVRLGADGSCFAVNAEWRRLSGLSEGDSLGDGWLAAIHGGDRVEFERAVRAGVQTEKVCRLLTPGGPRTAAYAVRAVVGVDTDDVGYVATFADIHEQAEVERELHDARARIAAAFQASSLGIALVQLDGTILEANARLGQLTGHAVDELVGQPLSALLVEGYAGLEAEVRLSLLSGQRPFGRFECRLAGESDEVTWVLASVALVDPVPEGPQYFVTELEDITTRKLAGEQLAHASLHDALTGLPNRVLLLDRMQHALARAQDSDGSVSLLFVDIDRFKSVNDRLGHHTGDEVLRAVAERISKAARPSDTVSRLGGDEFVILAEGLASDRDALRIGERCRRALAAPLVYEGTALIVDASIGIAFARGSFSDPHVMLREADAAMYEAKARGRGRCVIFDETTRSRLTTSVVAATRLRGAVERDEIVVHYQPIVRLLGGDMVGAEALARWQPENWPQVQPDDFIPVAEESDLILEIGRHVMEAACHEAASWRFGERGLRMSVNVSAQQLVAGDPAASIMRVLHSTGLDPSALCVELTESVLIEARSASASLQTLRDVGVHLAVDDFGTGYSSLAYLRHFPVDIVKIDRALVERLGSSARDRSIVAGIAALGRSMGMDIIVEGVERRDQVDTLIELGCEFGQGFVFGHPAAADAVLDPESAARDTRP